MSAGGGSTTFRQRLRGLFAGAAPAPTPELRSGLANPEDWLWDALGAQRLLGGERVTVETALALDAVYACVQLVAGTGGSIPLKVYAGEERERKPLTGDARYVMLHDAPNPEQAADVWLETVLAHLMLWGNAYLEKIRGPLGVVDELWAIKPSRVHPYRDERGRKRFRVDGAQSTDESGDYGEDRILHVPALGLDGLAGLSVIGIAISRTKHEARLYENDATPGGVLSVQGELDEEAAERIRAQWERLHKGRENRGRIAVLEAGATWQQVGLPLEDLQFIERERFTVGQVARLFNVPPEMIGGESGGSLTYANVESRSQHFLTFTLNRWLVRLEKGLRRDPDLFPERTVYPEFVRSALMRTDSRTRWQTYEIGRRVGALSPNDIRALENMPPRDGGDVYQDALQGSGAGATNGGGEGAGDGERDGEEALAGAALNGNGGGGQ
jgi:HK97 family phage portal protein